MAGIGNLAGETFSYLPALLGKAAIDVDELIARNRALEAELAATRMQADETVGDYAREIERWRAFAAQAGVCAAKVGGDLAAMTRRCEGLVARVTQAEQKAAELESVADAAAEERRATQRMLAMAQERIMAIVGVDSRVDVLAAVLERSTGREGSVRRA